MIGPLLAELRGRKSCLVVTGAGVSLASGIPTFRGSDPGAVWSADVMEMGTVGFFRRDPVTSWRWYLGRFDRIFDKEPNPAHHALVQLERWKRARGEDFLLITQNIDGLHARAGSQALVEVHGTAGRLRCSQEGCEHGAPRGWLPRERVDFSAFRADPRVTTLPQCPVCGNFLRPHVLWFDEYYTDHADYQYARVMEFSRRAELVIFVGTSFSVGVTAMTLEAGFRRQAPMYSIDPSGESPDPRVRVITAAAEHFLPDLVGKLS